MSALQSTDARIVPHSRVTVLACGGAVALAGLVYLNALHNPFVYDDHHTIVTNTSLVRLTDLRAIVLHDVTRPLVNASYAVDRALWGAAPFGFHVTSVLLHMLNVAVLFALARRLAGSLAAFAAAALLAVHPMMTEAVGYISGRSEVLCATAFMLAVLAGRRWLRDGDAASGAVTIALWVASIAAKELGAMFPFVLFAYDRLLTDGGPIERRRRLRRVHLPLISTALLAGLVRVAILTRIESPSAAPVHWSYLLVAAEAVRRYAGLLVYPTGQSLFHEVARVDLIAWRGLLAVAAVAAIGALAWRLRRTDPIATFGIVWFLLVLTPAAVLTVLDRGEPMAEHRVYLAACGLFLAAGEALTRLDRWAAGARVPLRHVAPVALALLIVSFGADTLVRNAVWHSPVALWRESVDLAPTHYRPRLMLGEALQDEGRQIEAAGEYRVAIQLRPADVTGRLKLGALLAVMGQFDEARHELLAVTALDPNNATARQALAILNQATPRAEDHERRR
jgi:tetratricopeptide (TPR) repeat protein